MSALRRRRDAPIDWAEVRARVARAMAATEEALRPSPERARRIMDERAQALARVPPAAGPGAERVELVTFALGGERYAVEMRCVREVARLIDVTPVPGTPGFVVGVTNLRGMVLAVIDLGRLFDLPRKGLTDLARIVVLGIDAAEVGVLADEVLGRVELAATDILEAPAEAAGIGRAHLRGVTRDALIVLDGAALLKDERLFVEDKKTD